MNGRTKERTQAHVDPRHDPAHRDLEYLHVSLDGRICGHLALRSDHLEVAPHAQKRCRDCHICAQHQLRGYVPLNEFSWLSIGRTDTHRYHTTQTPSQKLYHGINWY